jgi:hypothetical protein
VTVLDHQLLDGNEEGSSANNQQPTTGADHDQDDTTRCHDPQPPVPPRPTASHQPRHQANRQHDHTKLRVRHRTSAEEGDCGVEHLHASAVEAENSHSTAHLLKVDILTGPRRAAIPAMGAAHAAVRRPHTPTREATVTVRYTSPRTPLHVAMLLRRASRQILPTMTEIRPTWPWVHR